MAREAAVLHASLVLLHCPDAATQALVYPEQPDLALQQALNQTIAREIAGAGGRLFAQVVDRATYAAWLDGADSTMSWRKAFRDPARLAEPDAALKLFGVAAAPRRPARAPIRDKTRSPADQLVREWLDGALPSNPGLSAILDAGREGVVEMAIRKLEQRYNDEAVDDFLAWLSAGAEQVSLEPYGTAELFLLPVLPSGAAPPDAARLARGFVAAGLQSPGQTVEFLPAWFDTDVLVDLSPWALRRTLRALMAGRAPPDLAPVEPEGDAPVALLGLCRDRFPVPWEVAVEAVRVRADETYTPPHDPDDPATQALGRALEAWRAAMLEADAGLGDILGPTTPTLLAAMYDADADGPEAPDADLEAVSAEEVSDFIEVAAAEAGGEALVGVPRVIDGEVELQLYTASGRLLDSRVLAEAVDGMVPDPLRRIIGRYVTVASRRPGG